MMPTYTKTDYAEFEKINALQLAGYPQAAAAILTEWQKLRTLPMLYQPARGSESERELIAAYDRPGHNSGD